MSREILIFLAVVAFFFALICVLGGFVVALAALAGWIIGGAIIVFINWLLI